MELVLKRFRVSPLYAAICAPLLGCALISVCALIKIPFYPVPFTLQTLAIAFLGLVQKPKVAFWSAISYLACASLGLPILNGGLANSLWIVGNSAGYLLAFPVAAYLISTLKTRIHPLFAVLCGQIVIFGLGFAFLSSIFGITLAWTKGVLLFLPSDGLKAIAAFTAASFYKKIKLF